MARLRGRGHLGGDRELDSTIVRIGRAPENEIVIDDPGISRLHARLEHEAGVWRIVDCESTNGTRVDNAALRPWQPQALAHGAVVELGGGVATFDFLMSEDERAGGVAATVRQVAKRQIRLTPTEAEVLELLFTYYDEGRPSPRLATLSEIANKRFTSTAAVKMVLQGLYDKLDLFDEDRNKETLALRAQQWALTRTRY
jgi:pSer/pThr/pTyr-binding forkhead associated (FHA) protein